MKTPERSSILAIAFEGRRMSAAVVRRAGDRFHILKSYQTTLSLELLTSDPELAGREIRNHLNEAGIREKRCIVSAPLKWALTLQTEAPDLPDADLESFFTLQAEREFPLAPHELSIAVSRYRTPQNAGRAAIAAIPLNRIAVTQKVMKAARLRLTGITLGHSSLACAAGENQEGAALLLARENGVDLTVFAKGKIAALRTLEETEEGDEGFDVDSIVRQARITLGNLPPDLRESISSIRLAGISGAADPLLEELRSAAERMGMNIVGGAAFPRERFTDPNLLKKTSLLALGAAIGYLSSRSSLLEFLPPQESRFKRVTGLVLSRGALWLGGAAAAIILFLIAAFGYQNWRLSKLESQWKDLKPKAAEVEALQKQVRKFRAWFDDSVPSLDIILLLAQTFPEEGSVWVKSLEIKDSLEVSCSGSAKSNPDWLTMWDKLLANKEVGELQVQQMRGGSPLQFTLNFRWKGGLADGN